MSVRHFLDIADVASMDLRAIIDAAKTRKSAQKPLRPRLITPKPMGAMCC